jgi:acyl-coenzyme A thioesterase PaaI-like protein
VNVEEFLGVTDQGGRLAFSLGRDLQGAFEGAFGGVVAACALVAARRELGERRPVALDCRFLHAIPVGTLRAEVRVVNEGRTMSVAAVDLIDGRQRLAATALVTFAAQDALHALDDAGMVRPGASVGYAEASPWQMRKTNVPIVGTLEPRVALTDPGLVATVLRVPFDPEGAGCEAACLVADMAVEPPVAADLGDSWVPHPNADISLRFAGTESGPEMAGVARLERIAAGVATVRVEVFSGVDLIAVGISTALLLGMGVMHSTDHRR